MKDKFALDEATAIASQLIELLRPACERIVVAGSIRRRKIEVSDIEMLVIPRFTDGVDLLDRELGGLCIQGILGLRRDRRGRTSYGTKNKLMVHLASGVGVDIFSTDEECWWMSLAIRTGPKESNVAVAMAAQRKGWHLQAYGAGFSTPNGDVVCKSEREVFEFVDLPYQEPWGRE